MIDLTLNETEHMILNKMIDEYLDDRVGCPNSIDGMDLLKSHPITNEIILNIQARLMDAAKVEQ
jgi:hypothetical protein